MNKKRNCKSLSLVGISLCLGAASAWADPPINGNWTLTLNDDFNGTALNTSVWSAGMRWADRINNELQAYRPENVTVANGVCSLKVEKRAARMRDMTGYEWGNIDPNAGPITFNYASGCLQTYNKWTQTYGYFEARVRMCPAKGTWPAFWMLPDRGASYTNSNQRVTIGDAINGVSVPMGNEIDIFEYMATWKNPTTNLSKSHSGYIWRYGTNGLAWSAYTAVNQLLSPDTQYHTYGVYWGPGILRYFIDGVEVLSKEDTANISVVPEYLILNCALTTDDWTGTAVPMASIDADLASPKTMDIDYVKVYSGAPNVAYHKPVTASTAQGGLPASAAVDGSTGTRWGSGFADNQWIYVDLGQAYDISRAVVKWEAAYASVYSVQVSSNATSWTTIYSTAAGNGGTDDLTGLSGTGRYVRLLCTTRANPGWGNSVWEFEVYGTKAVVPNVALNKPAVASTAQGGLPASAAFDGSTSTRWSSSFADNQWIYVDLGQTYDLSRVTLKWETAYATGYSIQVSPNASTWTTIYSTTTGNGGTDELTGLTGSGRYVRLLCTTRFNSGWGNSLWEMEVY